MKRTFYLTVAIGVLAAAASCNNVSYQKTKSGVLYKIIPSAGKDSLAKPGDWLKVHFVNKINDSILGSSYGKMPGYAQVTQPENAAYDAIEVFPLLKKGDSAVVVLLVDSLMKKNPGGALPPFMKKGDRLNLTLKVIDVFRNDSLFKADRQVELVKDQPRQMKEQEEQAAKMEKEMKEQKQKEELEMEKSGDAAKSIQEVEDFLKTKNITAQKAGKGTFVVVQQQGTGPQAESGKYVTVKYAGKMLTTDSLFQANSYTFQLGKGSVIAGWDEGLELFKQGGKGTLYIPGFRAYGKNPPQGSPFKPMEALKFDVELLNVSDTMPQQAAQTIPQRRN